MTRLRRLLWLPLALMLAFTATACAAPADDIAVGDDTVIIDVRTPAEYAGGHLEGAVNIDFSAASFADEIGALDPDADYVVYCQSGNRSAQAVAAMEEAGFTSVQDAGGVSAASDATGIPIVS